MKSIYSLTTLQRILDHWGVGQIEDVTYFNYAGPSIWRHYITTKRGEYNLFSYPDSSQGTSEEKVEFFLKDRLDLNPDNLQQFPVVHSFDRYHHLLQVVFTSSISKTQASLDLEMLVGTKVQDIFRVYGTILQLVLNRDQGKVGTVSSYGSWSVQDTSAGAARVLVDSRMHHYSQLDEIIQRLLEEQPSVENIVLKRAWFEIYLSNSLSLHFLSLDSFAAATVSFISRRNKLVIFNERDIRYSRSIK